VSYATRPATILISVLLPQPLGPKTDRKAPSSTSRLTPCKASTLPRRDKKDFDSSWTAMAATVRSKDVGWAGEFTALATTPRIPVLRLWRKAPLITVSRLGEPQM